MTNVSIYKVTSCRLNLGGSYPVTSFRLNLEENSVPSITVGFDIHSTQNQTTPSVSTLTPGDYFSLYSKAQAACDAHQTAGFSFTSVSTKGDSQTINISGWVCAVAGFTRFTASGGLVFGITLKHPVCNLNYSASNLTNLKSSQLLAYCNGAQGTNPFDTLIHYMTSYSKQATLASQATPGIQKMHEQYKKIINLMSTYFDADGTKFPLSNAGAALGKSIKISVYKYAASLLNSSNPFRFLIDTFFPEWFFSLKPIGEGGTFNNKLKISPLEPWGEPKYRIDIKDINDFNFPSGDLEPLSGVYIVGFWETAIACTTFSTNTKLEKVSERSDGVACVDDQTAFGSIQRYAPPPWCTFGMSNLMGKPSTLKKRSSIAQHNEYNNKPKTLTISAETFLKYKKFMQKIVNDMFMIKYKAAISIAINARLMISTSGGMLLPGYVCDVYDGGNGIRFYITAISHFVDVKGQQARTEIQGRYVRRTEATCRGQETLKSEMYN